MAGDKIMEARRAAYLKFVVSAKDCGGPFENAELNKGWQVWNAALDSVVIELPKPEYFGDHWSGDWAIKKEDIVEAVEEIGLKVNS